MDCAEAAFFRDSVTIMLNTGFIMRDTLIFIFQFE